MILIVELCALLEERERERERERESVCVCVHNTCNWATTCEKPGNVTGLTKCQLFFNVLERFFSFFNVFIIKTLEQMQHKIMFCFNDTLHCLVRYIKQTGNGTW